MERQLSFAQAEYAGKKKTTRRDITRFIASTKRSAQLRARHRSMSCFVCCSLISGSSDSFLCVTIKAVREDEKSRRLEPNEDAESHGMSMGFGGRTAGQMQMAMDPMMEAKPRKKQGLLSCLS